MKVEKFKISNFPAVKRIYLKSFCKENRFSILNLLWNAFLKRANIYVALLKKEVVAFIYVIHYKNQRFILYLAVNESNRNQGIGTFLLKWYLQEDKGKDIFLNIDEVNEKYQDSEIRKKRLTFYQKNGFYLMNYLSVNDDTKGNILSIKERFDLEKYKLLDKKISKWFFCKVDKMEQLKY